MIRFLFTFHIPKGKIKKSCYLRREHFYAQIGYDAMLQRYQGSFNTFVGSTRILISSDTLQVKDYSRYNWTMFDPDHKKQRHEAVFPEDQKKAFALGGQMAAGSWAPM